MGFEDRDYLRDEQERYEGKGRWSGGGFRPGGGDLWAVKTLIVINIVAFIAQNATSKVVFGEFVGGFTSAADLSLQSLARFEIWRLLTYGFCHSADIWHIVFNMLLLWVFGRLVEPQLGSKEFLCFYLAAVVFSGAGHLVWQAVSGSPNPAIGASGAVMGVIILAARYYPREEVMLFFVVRMQLQYLALLVIVIDLISLFGRESRVAHSVHLAGIAFGLMYFQWHWNISGIAAAFGSPVASYRRKRADRERRRQLQVFDPGDENLREEVDRILAKISAHGEPSLTDEERKTLERASRVFRGR